MAAESLGNFDGDLQSVSLEIEAGLVLVGADSEGGFVGLPFATLNVFANP